MMNNAKNESILLFIILIVAITFIFSTMPSINALEDRNIRIVKTYANLATVPTDESKICVDEFDGKVRCQRKNYEDGTLSGFCPLKCTLGILSTKSYFTDKDGDEMCFYYYIPRPNNYDCVDFCLSKGDLCAEPYLEMTGPADGSKQSVLQDISIASRTMHPSTQINYHRLHIISQDGMDSIVDCGNSQECLFKTSVAQYPDGTRVKYWSELSLLDGIYIRNPDEKEISFTVSFSLKTQLTAADCQSKYDNIKGRFDQQSGYEIRNNPSKQVKLAYVDLAEEFSQLAESCHENPKIFSRATLMAGYTLRSIGDLKKADEYFLKAYESTKIYEAVTSFSYKDVAEYAAFQHLDILAQEGKCREFIEQSSMLSALGGGVREQIWSRFETLRAKCDVRISKDVELISGNGDKKKIDLFFIGIGFESKEELRTKIDLLKDGLFYVQPWETLGKKEYQDMFNMYMYTKPLPFSTVFITDHPGPDYSYYGLTCPIKGTNNLWIYHAFSGYYNIIVYNDDGGYNPVCRSNKDPEIGNFIAVALYPEVLEDGVPVFNRNMAAFNKAVKDDPSWQTENSNDKSKTYYDPEGKLVSIMPEVQKYYSVNRLVLLHELGHVIFGLNDEYVEETGYQTLWGPNCANSKEEMQNKVNELPIKYFDESIVGVDTTTLNPAIREANDRKIYRGCSLSDKYWRFNKNSIMNHQYIFAYANQKGSFGQLNDYYIKEILDEKS